MRLIYRHIHTARQPNGIIKMTSLRNLQSLDQQHHFILRLDSVCKVYYTNFILLATAAKTQQSNPKFCNIGPLQYAPFFANDSAESMEMIEWRLLCELFLRIFNVDSTCYIGKRRTVRGT